MRSRFPAFGERTLRLLAEARAGTSPSESERLLVSAVGILVGELRDHVPDYMVLVVDDYHLLDASASARGVLELLLDRLPAHMHVVLLSRTVPVLDTSRLLLADEVGGLGPPDLAFTPDELGFFLRQRYRIEPDSALVEQLHQRTEGWIAGVVLAMPAPVDGPPSARTAALRSTLAESWSGGERLREYLAGQLFRRQSPEDQDLLLAEAVTAYGGPFLPDCYSDWAAVERHRLEQRYITALAQLIDAEWTAGDYRACLEWCQRLLEVEDAEDAIHCRALDCYERLGEPLAGVLHYRRYARELAEQDQGQLSTRAGVLYRRLEAALVGG